MEGYRPKEIYQTPAPDRHTIETREALPEVLIGHAAARLAYANEFSNAYLTPAVNGIMHPK